VTTCNQVTESNPRRPCVQALANHLNSDLLSQAKPAPRYNG